MNISFSSTGMIVDWKNHLTVAMNGEFDTVFKKEMKDSYIQVQFEKIEWLYNVNSWLIKFLLVYLFVEKLLILRNYHCQI